MLDFNSDENITGGNIVNWSVDKYDQTPDRSNNVARLSKIINRSRASKSHGNASFTFDNLEVTTDNRSAILGIDRTWCSPGGASNDEFVIVQKCNDRLELLAMAYSDSISHEFHRELHARIRIIETELDQIMPRYSEQNWKLLLEFKQLIDELKTNK